MMSEGGGVLADSWNHSTSAPAQTFGAVLDASPDALLAIAADGSIVLVNAAAGRLFGYRPGDLTGRDHRSLLAEGFRGEADQLFARLRALPGDHPPPREIYGLHSDGTEFPAEATGSLLPWDAAPLFPPASPGNEAPPRTPDGKQGPDDGSRAHPLLLLSVRGTSHRQAADADLREAMSLLTATLESTADGILVMSSEGRVAGFNDQFLTM